MQSRDPGHAFGVLLRRYREAAGLTQEALAERAGLSARGISDLERGVIRVPRPDTLGLLVRALGLAPPERARLEAAAHRYVTVAAGDRPRDDGQPVLVGRKTELALLERHLAEPGPPVLVLAGEPGIGKSRLLRHVAQQARSAGWQVLAGGCGRRGGQAPYAPLLEALEHYLRSRSPVQLRADLQGCAWLVRLLPELAEGPIQALPPWTLSPEQERRLLFRAVARFLANVAGPRGTVLVLDDLQWAGSDALDLLSTLVRDTETPPRLVGAYRDTDVQADDRLAVTLADLAQAGLARRHALTPLAAAEVGQLLDTLLEGVQGDRARIKEQVARRAEGIPFFVISCAQGLGGDDATEDGDALPWDVQQSIRQREAALSAVTREVLRVAAVVGRVAPPALLTAVIEQPERAVLGALDAACQARLLTEGDEGYRFAHDLIREVIEAEVGYGSRLALHRRIGDVLERQAIGLGGELPVAALAYHYGRGDAEDKALLYLERAGDGARNQAAHTAAEGYYREVLARLDSLGLRLDGARVREKLGGVLTTAGHNTAALDVLAQAAETLRLAGEMESLGQVLARIANLYDCRGTPADLEAGVACLQPLLEPLEALGPSRGLAAMFCSLAALRITLGQHREGMEAALRAAEVARVVGDRGLLAKAEWSRGWLLAHMGQVTAALPVLREAGRVAEAMDMPDILSQVLWFSANIHEDRGELDLARQYAGRALSLAERLADPVLIRHATIRLGVLAFFAGDWGQARRYYEGLEALPDRTADLNAGPLLELGRLCLAEGSWEQGARYLEECSAGAHHFGHLILERVAQSYLAERDLLEGRPDLAHARLIPLLDRSGLEEQVVTTYVLPVLAWAHLELGNMDQAAQVITDAVRRARAGSYRLTLVVALRIQALVALRQGDMDSAEHALEEGLALAQAIPYPHGEGRLLEVFGLLRARKGEVEPARERLEQALVIFRRLGARKDVERAEHDLVHLGI